MMVLGAMQSSGGLRLLQGGPARRGEAAGLLGGRFLWLEALRLELELVVMAAAGGGKDPRGGRERERSGGQRWKTMALGAMQSLGKLRLLQR